MVEALGHPFFIHFPVAISFLLPFFVVGVLYLERKGSDVLKPWAFVFFSMAILTFFTVLAAVSGGNGVEYLENRLSDGEFEILHRHEEIAEIFIMSAYINTGLSVFVFLYKEVRRRSLLYIILLISLFQFGLGLYTGKTGGNVIYKTSAIEHLQKLSK